MSVQARWGGGTTAAPQVAPVCEDLGRLGEELQSLMAAEGELYNCGIRCPIRETEGSVCSVCPLSKHQDRLDPLQPLCTIGRKSDAVLTRMAIAQHGAGCAT